MGRPSDQGKSELAELEQSKLGQEYTKINPQRSLLLFDCTGNTPWCNDPAFQFGAIFAMAARSQPDAAIQALYASAVSAVKLPEQFTDYLGNWQGNSAVDAPFQLLAIVNRMDLASWDSKSGLWSGGEVRFVYGSNPINGNAGNFTLIIEFRLPPFNWQDYQKLAQAWVNVDVSDDKMLSGLKVALSLSRYTDPANVRIRANFAVIADTDWDLMQWDFVPSTGSGPAVPVFKPMTDLLDPKYLLATQEIPGYRNYLALFKSKLESVGFVSQIAVPQSVLQQYNPRTYQAPWLGMSTPIPLDSCGFDFVPSRNAVGLQQCNLCHTVETGTLFQHIANRRPGENAKLSLFLTGNTLKPTLEQLYNATASEPVTVNFQTYTGDQCKVRTCKTVTRQFHDLARRSLFLAALITAPQPSDPAFERAEKLVLRFTTKMTD